MPDDEGNELKDDLLLNDIFNLLGLDDDAREKFGSTIQGQMESGAESEVQPVRLSHLIGLLRQIEEHAAPLANAIDELDQLDERLGRGVGMGYDSETLVSATHDNDVPGKLRRLVAAAAADRNKLTELFGSGNQDKPDAGGPALSQRLFGKPKRQFVKNMEQIWKSYPPDAPSKRPRSQLTQFVELCWTFATRKVDIPGLKADLEAPVPAGLRRKINYEMALAYLNTADGEDTVDENLRLGVELILNLNRPL